MKTVNVGSNIKDNIEDIRRRLNEEYDELYRMERSNLGNTPGYIQAREYKQELIDMLEELIALKKALVDMKRFNFDILRGSIIFAKEELDLISLTFGSAEDFVRKQIAKKCMENIASEINLEKADFKESINCVQYIGSLIVARRTEDN